MADRSHSTGRCRAENCNAVSCDPGMIAINCGDIREMASGGYFPSTVHRVVNLDRTENGTRFSMPMFLHPRPDVVLKPGTTADDFLNERLSEIGLKSGSRSSTRNSDIRADNHAHTRQSFLRTSSSHASWACKTASGEVPSSSSSSTRSFKSAKTWKPPFRQDDSITA